LTVPPGREVVVIESAAAWAMVSWNVAFTITGGVSESVTVTLTVAVPTTSVVPEIVVLGVPDVE
jgi:hypothetical protein